MARTLKDLRRSHKKALVIAAHPDDESLFIGGTMAEFKKWCWTVLCVTDCDRRHNARRCGELLRACRTYRRSGNIVTPFMLGVVKRKGRFSKKEIKSKIRDFIREFGPFDVFFTHGHKGDYGHRTHRLVHQAVKALKLGEVYGFCVPGQAGRAKRQTQAVALSPRSRHIKTRAVAVYSKGSQKTNLRRLDKTLSQRLSGKKEWFSKVD